MTLKRRKKDEFMDDSAMNENVLNDVQVSDTAYAYPKVRVFSIVMRFGVIFVAVLFGYLFGSLLWSQMQPAQHHILYPSSNADIAAKFTGQPIVLDADLMNVVCSSSYYETNAYKALSPVMQDDGSCVLTPHNSDEMYDFLTLVRAELEATASQYASDSSVVFFESGVFTKDYDKLSVMTPMKKDSLIDREAANNLLAQMKIQAWFYWSVDTQVSIVFVNNESGANVLTLRM